ncbi:MAG: MarR family winged helix-turn-helix transcriptional regulator [Aestuariivirga sp.]|uniref:MarR family winged helix-turn-helix transcriptional regulator n=1 Tax=Aestuariivirga sp. TaxID=2650926 RepID=UPI0038D02319
MTNVFSPSQYFANIVGALSVGLADRIVEETEALVGVGANASAALVLIGSRPDLTIDDLRHGMKLTHSATVRTVMRLNAAGLVEKRSGRDGRSVYLRLNAKGRRDMNRALQLREKIVGEALSALNPAELAQFGAMAARVLPKVVTRSETAEVICRLCDGKVCTDAECPLTKERDCQLGAEHG